MDMDKALRSWARGVPMLKAEHAPAGYSPMLHSKHGGWHKRDGPMWLTWYPKTGHGLHATERFTDKQHKAMYDEHRGSTAPEHYRDHLEDVGHEVSRENIAGHAQFLERNEPALKHLSAVISTEEGRSFGAGGHFTKEQMDILTQAKYILQSANVPLRELKEKATKPLWRPGKK